MQSSGFRIAEQHGSHSHPCVTILSFQPLPIFFRWCCQTTGLSVYSTCWLANEPFPSVLHPTLTNRRGMVQPFDCENDTHHYIVSTKIHGGVLNYTYPLDLINPATIPDVDEDPIFFPTPIGIYSNGSDIVSQAERQINSILAGPGSNCSKCILRSRLASLWLREFSRWYLICWWLCAKARGSSRTHLVERTTKRPISERYGLSS